MKSRMTITTMLVVGALMSMSGAGLAVSGSSGSGSAAGVQYQTETTASQGVSGQGKVSEKAPQVKPAQQVAAASASGDSGDELPFTGYSALPVLLGGLGVLGAGLVLRRRSQSNS